MIPRLMTSCPLTPGHGRGRGGGEGLEDEREGGVKGGGEGYDTNMGKNAGHATDHGIGNLRCHDLQHR